MKLPFLNKLSAVTGAFARLNPMGLLAKIKSRKTKDTDGDEDREFLPSGGDGDDLFADLGDLDQLDAEANEPKEGDAKASEADDDFGDFDNKELDEFDENEFDEQPSSGGAHEDAESWDDELGGDAPKASSSASASDSVMEDLDDFSLDDEDDDEDEDDEEAQKAKLKKLLMLAGGGVVVALVLGGLVWLVVGGDGANSPTEDAVAQSQAGSAGEAGGMVISLDNVPPYPDATKNAPTSAQSTSASGVAAQPDRGGEGLAPPMSTPSQTGTAPMAPSGTGSQTEAPAEQTELSRLGLEVQMEPGVGVVIPAGTPASYEKIEHWPAAEPLADAPVETLVEPGEHGLLPKIGPDGQTPFEAYARPAPPKSGDPKIAVIVTGLGMSRASTEAAIATLPADVALSLDVYARGLDFWVKRARTAGHEVLLNMPSESSDFPFSDPGPNALQTLAPPDKNIQQLEWMLSRTTGYFGVLSVYGSKFLTVEEQVKAVMDALKQRGLMYVDGGGEDSLGSRVAYQVGAKWASVDLTLDNTPGSAALDLQLAEFEALAKKRAIAIARVSATPLTLQRLSTWLKSLKAKGLQLVPVSALANKQLIR